MIRKSKSFEQFYIFLRFSKGSFGGRLIKTKWEVTLFLQK